ncbi:hypothetical protein A9P82_08755 [Arachidicoccus ginsenosidimutans]|uniref:hypothetical protein n=1 Tax=Arachidicoccus sp. BS20 TaxID=1850526 RepID=UPI0007F11441|nr:hypothetical protein [Arachidicoccus sp. BS20]ANI89372.1 hypothetical protein A9P82_08755 [Arachidicoccus sp. BS20]
MAKSSYKVSYKTYFNDRLKEVSFHGKHTYPLYVQITFDRKTIFFKSYYFELFSKPKYFLFVPGVGGKAPSIEIITKLENAVIEFIIDKYADAFSLELFKKEYDFYTQDLCDAMEEGFIDYLYTFLQDKGMPTLAIVVKEGSRYRTAYEVVRDMKRAFTPKLYEELVENSFYYAPPYFPLYGFVQEMKKSSALSLSVMEWESGNMQASFEEYVKSHFPNIDTAETIKDVNKWLERLRKKAELPT